MAIRNIRLEGDEILKKKSREVEVIDEKTQILIDDMIETMHKYNGVGLAAVQVGVLKRIVVTPATKRIMARSVMIVGKWLILCSLKE